ncbi:hypothetical protein ElyMa_003433000 [Elysia marginata]|uniref:Uncharacterized protein n=1 Tax=Elysia marginata TaxID=1093978 RepID=A0AAV4JS24_9GAST|nr:hypothetical protein ElyMa_003433000 [Elysia marginata]
MMMMMITIIIIIIIIIIVVVVTIVIVVVVVVVAAAASDSFFPTSLTHKQISIIQSLSLIGNTVFEGCSSNGCHYSPPAFSASTFVDYLAKRQPSGCRDVVHQ